MSSLLAVTSSNQTTPIPQTTSHSFDPINQAAQAFFSKIAEKRNSECKNHFFFTPALLPLFGMLYGGAPEEAKEAFETFLHVQQQGEDIHETYGTWLNSIKRTPPKQPEKSLTEFLLTPLFWLIHRIVSLFKTVSPQASLDQGILVGTTKGVSISETAEQNLKKYGEHKRLNFENAQEAQDEGNKWIAEKTDGAIPELIQNLPDSLGLLLTTAGKLNSQWVYSFDKNWTYDGEFKELDRSKSKIKTMAKISDEIRWAHETFDGKTMSLLELPMHGGLAMYYVVPSWTASAQDIAPYLASDAFRETLSKVDEENSPFKKQSGLEIFVPKLDLKDRINVLEELENDPLIEKIKMADWAPSLITRSNNDIGKISQIQGETQLTLDESGVQVKAAFYSGCALESCPPRFSATQPHGLVLFDRKTQTILGMGQINTFKGN